MRLSVNIKRKDPKFQGDQPSWYIVVSGPAETFTDALRRMLYLHGLNELSEQGEEHQTWSSRPAIGAPPLYLAALLRDKHRARLKPETAEMLRVSHEERLPEDGLEKFIGRSKAASPGSAPLAIVAGSVDFVANCDAVDEDREQLLAGAGWLPIVDPSETITARFGTRPYRTRDPFIASNLEPFMNPNALQRMKEGLAAAKGRIALSKTQQAPSDFAIAAPEGLDYLPFQKAGIDQVLKSRKSAIIADDMGLGKTVQGIGILNGITANLVLDDTCTGKDRYRAIVFCQANMRLKWVREINKWKLNQGLTVGHAEGKDWPDTDVVVINYDIVKNHVDRIRATDWNLVLADEAHNLKNEEAIRTQSILGDLLTERGEGMIPLAPGGQLVHLTGTPKPNRVSELWPLLTSSRPDLWGRGPAARQAFLNRYEPPVLIKKKMRRGSREYEIIIPMPGKPVRELELQLRLRGSGSFIRRLKRDTDLPPKFRTPIEMPFKLTKEELAVLRQAEADLDEIQQRLHRGEGARIGVSQQAREIIDVISGLAPDSPQFQEIARVRRNLGVLKAPHAARFIIDELREDDELAEEDRRKTVVFAHHKEVIETIRAMAEAEIPGGVLVYDGSVANKLRQDRIDRFMEDPKARLFIMSLAGATGITLTAAARMRVVEPDWSPSNMVQIEDRIWRIGQEENCDIGYLFVPETLDSRVGMALIDKMETDERSINSLGFRGLRKKEKPAAPPRDPANRNAPDQGQLQFG
ncbi:DEAD/DEAH box helicase [Cereibacter sphaeroides]|nr:DEAD/DEAH box helicase [Cereibacter sphaeroides]MCE6959247.1 DEAD/DEAH box helicase [Cereibacter sphaeroides]MCE6972050.1 DEAD/DEAH box helicase [Cereibacter sphaeroides]